MIKFATSELTKMANVHSAIKQIRKDAKKRNRNQARLSELHSLWKKLTLVPKSETAKAKPLAQTLISKWDRAASKGFVPKERANRKKTRIALFLKKLSQ